jgi:hypothetical protein
LIDPKLPELRQDDGKKNRPIGVESCVWGVLYPAGLSPLELPRQIDGAGKPSAMKNVESIQPPSSMRIEPRRGSR